jgi:carbon monoxide dehydrogenase subunit G
MKLSGSYEFDANAAKVWDALTDPESLQQCIPGCEGLRHQGNNVYEAELTVGVGPIRGKYKAKISMEDQVQNSSYRLVVQGTGATGFVNGDAQITLVETNGKTTVTVDADSQAGGPVMRVGQRLMGSVGKTMMDRFFSCMQKSAG